FTDGELPDYCRDLVDILFRIAEGAGRGATAALDALPNATANLGFDAKPTETIKRFEKLVQWANADESDFNVSALAGALNLFQDRLSQVLDNPEFPLERKIEFEGYISQVRHLKGELE